MRTVVVFALLLASGAQAQMVHVGDDPAGDSSNDVVPGTSGGALISEGRTDILTVDMEQTDSDLRVSLTLTELPAGTSGYLYRVVFDIGGERYFTCYAVQWTGGEDAQENVLGCSRFLSNTQVGPATSGEGLEMEGTTITWPVPRSQIGGAGIADVATVHADTWFRGLSDCCVGSTQHSQYLWNRADRGPDADQWIVSFASTPEVPQGPAVTLDVNGTERSAAPPGGWAAFDILLNATRSGNVILSLDAPWNATGLGNVTVAANETTQHQIQVHVPNGTDAGTHILTLNATLHNATTLLELIVDVDPDAPSSPPGNEATPDAPGTTPDGNDAQTGDGDPGSVEEESPLPLLVVMAALAVATHKRRSK